VGALSSVAFIGQERGDSRHPAVCKYIRFDHLVFIPLFENLTHATHHSIEVLSQPRLPRRQLSVGIDRVRIAADHLGLHGFERQGAEVFRGDHSVKFAKNPQTTSIEVNLGSFLAVLDVVFSARAQNERQIC